MYQIRNTSHPEKIRLILFTTGFTFQRVHSKDHHPANLCDVTPSSTLRFELEVCLAVERQADFKQKQGIQSSRRTEKFLLEAVNRGLVSQFLVPVGSLGKPDKPLILEMSRNGKCSI